MKTVSLVKTGMTFALSCWMFAGCISPQSPLAEAGGDCPEFATSGSGQQVSGVAMDSTVKVFMEASADFSSATSAMKAEVKEACINVAHDLGASDTWSEHGEEDLSISNPERTGACDVAADKIREIMEGEGALAANFALTVTRGACHYDFAEQERCDRQCDADQACTPGSVETRCEPGELSMLCENTCTTDSYCQGTETTVTNCVGSCEARCTGECTGTCIDSNGRVTQDDPNCNGKCNETCKGTCTGLCQITETQGVHCGSEVYCKGSCSGSYSDPVCESEFTPPDCSMNAECHESCRARVAANPICEPSKVQLIANVDAASNSPDVQKLVATINANLPKILDVAEVKGQVALDAVETLSETGQIVVDKSGNLDGKSLACAKVSTKAALEALESLKLLNQSSKAVTDTCRDRAM